MKKQIRRALRMLAFGLGAGIVFITAGSITGMTPLAAGVTGGLGAVLVVIVALSFEYAAKGHVSDDAFDEAINTGIQKVKSDTDKKSK